jgi:hypothetical protein
VYLLDVVLVLAQGRAAAQQLAALLGAVLVDSRVTKAMPRSAPLVAWSMPRPVPLLA